VVGWFGGATFRDSLVIGPHTQTTIEVSGTGAQLRNLTTNGGVWVVGQSYDPTTSATATNVIALGGFSGFRVANPGGTNTVTMAVDHSYGGITAAAGGGATVTSGAGNLPASPPPAFVDAANGNYHEQGGSPTVDKGIDNVANGLTDFDGGARSFGVATDIGADEFGTAAPTVSTGDPSAATQTTANVAGTVNANGVGTTARFEYGPTTSYGSQTPDTPVAGDFAAHPASANLAGLAPSTTYHYRVVGGSGAAYGQDRTFTTEAAPAAPGTDTTGGGTPPGTGPTSLVTTPKPFTILGARSVPKTGGLLLTLLLPGAGVLDVAGTAPLKGAARVRVLKAFKMHRVYSKGGRLELTLKPSAAAANLLKHGKRLTVKLLVTFTPAGGRPVTLQRKLALKLTRR
jgi:hypothetical protein